MKNPPLLPPLLAVMLLAIANLELKGHPITAAPSQVGFGVAAIALLGAGMVLTPLLNRRGASEEKPLDDEFAVISTTVDAEDVAPPHAEVQVDQPTGLDKTA